MHRCNRTTGALAIDRLLLSTFPACTVSPSFLSLFSLSIDRSPPVASSLWRRTSQSPHSKKMPPENLHCKRRRAQTRKATNPPGGPSGSSLHFPPSDCSVASFCLSRISSATKIRRKQSILSRTKRGEQKWSVVCVRARLRGVSLGNEGRVSE